MISLYGIYTHYNILCLVPRIMDFLSGTILERDVCIIMTELVIIECLARLNQISFIKSSPNLSFRAGIANNLIGCIVYVVLYNVKCYDKMMLHLLM